METSPINHTSDESQLSFSLTLQKFPWTVFRNAVQAQALRQVQHYATQLVLDIVPFVMKHPTVPVNKSCLPDPVRFPRTKNCTKLSNPRKVAILVQFGFDVCVLEILLHELDEFVDRFFLTESLMSHSRFVTKKLLIWDRLKDNERFQKFAGKVVHFVLDDEQESRNPGTSMWARESWQERLRWEKFLQWNKNSNDFFKNEHLLGFGDVDEIPDRNNVAFLKNCELPGDPIDIGIWFPFSGIDTAFRSDYPVPGHDYTFGDPTFWSLGRAINYYKDRGECPNRMQGKSGSYLLGGMHLSKYVYAPFQMIKVLTQSSCGWEHLKTVIKAGMGSGSGSNINQVILGELHTRLKYRIIPLESLRKGNEAEVLAIVKIPWFLKCNLNRYPSFMMGNDSRLS